VGREEDRNKRRKRKKESNRKKGKKREETKREAKHCPSSRPSNPQPEGALPEILTK